MNKKIKIHVVSYTHWDREFRFDFETTRTWLVQAIDNLLDTMEKELGCRHFLMDGQFVLIDDYLEIRPEKEEQMRKLTAEGRLQLGPWYSLPDSSSIHGESLIRNLMMGLSRSREFGGAMEVGYNIFSFGQIAQLPQIYMGFDTGIQAETTSTGSVFDVTAYPTAPTRDGDFRGQELTRHQQHMFMDISNGKDGLAFLSDSLRDYEVIDHNSGTIAQSLIRGVDIKVPCDNRFWLEYPGDHSAQSLGINTTRYGIMPHEKDWQEAGVCKATHAFNVPMRVAQIGKQQGTLPCEKSFVEIMPENLVLSAFKKAEDRDSAIVRIYNPTENTVKGSLVFGKDIVEAYYVNFNEDRQAQIRLDNNNRIEISIKPKKITTIELIFR